jgi:serine protease Do
VERFLVLRGRRPYLGVDVQPVAVPLGGHAALGLLLLAVADGSPAEQAGLMIGDVVVGIAGRALGEPSDLPAALNAAGSGGTVRVDLIRGGRRVQHDVLVGEQTAQNEALEDDAA